ncbi:MAG: N-acetylmuramoyl-L-alanine amidase [Cyanobacteria bacterium P01_A01_bin.135]
MNYRILVSSGLGMLGALLLASPALAARLESWQFNTDAERLLFTTDEVVRPRAQLLQNPTRILIDLPDTRAVDVDRLQAIGGAVRQVRVDQLTPQVTRLTIEYNDGYTIDPRQVRVQGLTPTQWQVQLPAARRGSVRPISQPTRPASPAPSRPVAQQPTGPTRITGISAIPEGLLLETTGEVPEVDEKRRRRGRLRDRLRLGFEVEDTTLASALEGTQSFNRYGIRTVELEQDRDDVRVTLNLLDENQAWEASADASGVLFEPEGGVRFPVTRRPISRDPDPVTAPEPGATVVSGLSLTAGQLVVEANQPVVGAIAGFNRRGVDYRVVIPDARLAPGTATELRPNPIFARAILTQEGNQVVLSVLPAVGTELGGTEATDAGLNLIYESSRANLPPGLPGTPPPGTSRPIQPGPLPQIPNNRIVVVIDPGHGGFDPGAVGIGGLQEKNVVLPISLQVAQILEQQGVGVIMTRRVDRELDLEPRVQIAERANATLFVSIHANAISMSRPDVNGVETFYVSGEGQRFAQFIQRGLLQVSGGPDRGVRRARFYVLVNTSMPAILVEVGFVTGAQDAPRLATSAYQTQLAQAIARGILEYIQQTYR